jgi:transglutaminase-like putative cysteine protease
VSGRIQPRATLVAALAVVLAASSLGAIYGHWRWIEPVLLGTAVVAIAGAVSRSLRLPAVVHPVVGAVALLLTVTARFVGGDAFAGFIPTAHTWSVLHQQYSFGLHDLTTGSAPYPATTGSLLIATAGVGLVALAVDLFAVSARHPSLAGVPLLALVVVPSAGVGGGIGIVPFLLAGAGFLGLLALEAGERAGRWGRALSGPAHGSLAAESAAGSAGWRIGTVTLGAALLIPLAIPGADHSPFHGGSGGGGGNSSTTVINPFVQIQTQLHSNSTTTLLTVHSAQPTYQRLTALENFGDDGFTLRPLSASSSAKVEHGLPAPDTGTSTISTTTVQETVTAAPQLAERFLPVPQSATAVQVVGDWRLAEPTATIFSSRTDTEGKTWSATAAVPAPSVATLRKAGTPKAPSAPYSSALASDLQVPTGLPSVVHATAQEWANEAHATTVYDIANALQAHFNDTAEFTYNLNATVGPGLDGFAQFLRDRQGYCEQFASTMVAMLRTMGIPARVAIGFTAGTQRDSETSVITNQNAHAWPEVWFATAGWVRFEPTPLSDGTADLPSYTQAPSGTNGTNPTTAPSATAPTTGPSAATPQADGPKPDAAAPAATSVTSNRGHSGLSAAALAALAVLAALIVLVAAPRGSQLLRRRRRWRAVTTAGDPAAAARLAWALLLEDAIDRDVEVLPSASPRQAGRLFAAAVSGSDPAVEAQVTAAVATLVPAVERARYARGPLELALDDRRTDLALVDGAVSLDESADQRATAEAARETDAVIDRLRNAAHEVRRGLDHDLSRVRRIELALFPRSARQQALAPFQFASRSLGHLADVGVGLLVHARRALPGTD